MSRIIDLGGRIIEVPDDATPEEINEISNQRGTTKTTTAEMEAEMRQRGISEQDIKAASDAMRLVPGAEMSLNAPQAPSKPQMKPMTNPTPPRWGQGHLLERILGPAKPNPVPKPAWLEALGKASDVGNRLTPSPATAVSLVAPGAPVAGGLLKFLGQSALRGGAVGATRAAEAALGGEKEPLAKGAVQGAAQMVPELAGRAASTVIPPVAKAVANYGIPMVSRNVQTARQARAMNDLAQAMRTGGRAPGAPGVPGENMVRYEPKGWPAVPPTVSPVLGPGGKPIITHPGSPAVPPVQLRHPTLLGWLGADILNPIAAASKKAADQIDPVQVLMRLLGAGAQEAESRNR